MKTLVAVAEVRAAPKDTEKRLTAAADTMGEIMGTPDKSIPQDLLNKAECAVWCRD